jgi:hypothetical protein
MERTLQKNLLNLLSPTTLQLHNNVNFHTTQDVSKRLQIVEAWFRSQCSPCGICGEQSSTGTDASVRSSQLFSIQYLLFVYRKLRYSDWLRAGRLGDRIPVVARFFAPFLTGPGVHRTSYNMGTRSFVGVKQPGRGVDFTPLSSAEVKERVEVYL